MTRYNRYRDLWSITRSNKDVPVYGAGYSPCAGPYTRGEVEYGKDEKQHPGGYPFRGADLETVLRERRRFIPIIGETVACVEPNKVYSPLSTELISDPSFENYLVDHSPPFGDAIPTRAHDTPSKQPHVCPCDVQYMDTTSASDWLCAGVGHSWFNWDGQYNSTLYWGVRTTNPQAGTYHARWDSGLGSTLFGPSIAVHGNVPDWGEDGFTRWAFSGSCHGGDTITFSLWEMATLAGGTSAQSNIGLEFHDSSSTRGPAFGLGTFDFSGNQVTPQTYTQRTYVTVAPTQVDPIYFIASYYPTAGQLGDTFDIDNASLVVT